MRSVHFWYFTFCCINLIHKHDDDDDDDLAFIERTFYVDILRCALHYSTGALTRLLVSASSNHAVYNLFEGTGNR